MKRSKEEIEVQLFSSSNEYEINQVCTILTENNISFIRKDDGSGAYMNLYMGQSIQVKRIFVNRNDYNKSIELISPFISNEIENKDVFELDEKVESDENRKNYILIRRGLGFFILGVPIFLIILVIVMSFIYN